MHARRHTSTRGRQERIERERWGENKRVLKKERRQISGTRFFPPFLDFVTVMSLFLFSSSPPPFVSLARSWGSYPPVSPLSAHRLLESAISSSHLWRKRKAPKLRRSDETDTKGLKKEEKKRSDGRVAACSRGRLSGLFSPDTIECGTPSESS